MKIWIPTIRAGSGADVFALRLSQALRRAGHEPLLQWFDRRYEFLPELLRRYRKPPAIDVIHADSSNAWAFLGRDAPVVATVHHLVHDPAYAPYRSSLQALHHRLNIRWREALAIRHSAAVTAVSSYVAQTVKDVFGRESVNVIGNWVNNDLYTSSLNYRPIQSGKFRLLMVGNQSRRKGYDLLPAFSKALGANFDLRCTAGLRDERGGSELPNVSTLGKLSEEELISEYQHCDAVVSLSRYEGFGYTALEGMACGKPFIGFHTSGLTDVVVDEVTGFLLPINDISALAARCVQLAEHPSMLEHMGQAGRERALSVFDESTAANAYVELYRKIISVNS
ncbi:glycosyltransferase family 4 protein [Dyella tabacisoli]|uniref:glycosyltransferase family 4 protein n=1 Tax=Dyella tabacisoli TaxID=2282381 RepID=UPI0013B3EBBA|nr:glycosyltransferase family 4 protein [Dyella tabacisoli]